MFAIRLSNQPIWFCDGKEELYVSESDAEQALIDEMQACQQAYEHGYMEDAGDFDDYRIVKVK